MDTITKIRNGEVDETELLEYVTSNDVELALAVACSDFATASILKIAAWDKDDKVRLAVINNKNTNDDTIRLLCNDEKIEIKYAAKEELKRRNL